MICQIYTPRNWIVFQINFNFADEYFVSNIEKVDSVTLLRKDKVMNGVGWTLRFQQALNTWPCLSDLGAAAATVRCLFIIFFTIF